MTVSQYATPRHHTTTPILLMDDLSRSTSATEVSAAASRHGGLRLPPTQAEFGHVDDGPVDILAEYEVTQRTLSHEIVQLRDALAVSEAQCTALERQVGELSGALTRRVYTASLAAGAQPSRARAGARRVTRGVRAARQFLDGLRGRVCRRLALRVSYLLRRGKVAMLRLDIAVREQLSTRFSPSRLGPWEGGHARFAQPRRWTV